MAKKDEATTPAQPAADGKKRKRTKLEIIRLDPKALGALKATAAATLVDPTKLHELVEVAFNVWIDGKIFGIYQAHLERAGQGRLFQGTNTTNEPRTDP